MERETYAEEKAFSIVEKLIKHGYIDLGIHPFTTRLIVTNLIEHAIRLAYQEGQIFQLEEDIERIRILK